MEDKHSIIISMAEYEKFMGYEKFINEIKANNDNWLEYTFSKVFNAIDAQANEYVRVSNGMPKVNISSGVLYVMKDFKERLSNFKKSCSEKLVDMFIKETIDNTINKDNQIILTEVEHDGKLVLDIDDIIYILRCSHGTRYDVIIHSDIENPPYTVIGIVKDSIEKTFKVNETVDQIIKMIRR